MRRVIELTLAIIIVALSLSSCSENKQHNSTIYHPFEGKFITEHGMKVELRSDSTAIIVFSDTLTYQSQWKIRKTNDQQEYANIEFAGNQEYYYLKDNKLYRSMREMDHDLMGIEVQYQD